MHTRLAGDACREALGIQYDGEDEAQRLYRHDRSFSAGASLYRST